MFNLKRFMTCLRNGHSWSHNVRIEERILPLAPLAYMNPFGFMPILGTVRKVYIVHKCTQCARTKSVLLTNLHDV